MKETKNNTMTDNGNLRYSSLFCQLKSPHKLHVKRIHGDSVGKPVLMLHGMVENGRIFYHESGKGLGSYLAKQGYDVYVADFRGQGLSTPKITRRSRFGQTERVCEDIPALIEFVYQHSGQQKMHLIAHSWGGVVANASLLRFPHLLALMESGVYFGTKRTVRAKTREKIFNINVMWNGVGTVAAKTCGYLPAIALKMGADNETHKMHRQCVEWIEMDDWVDTSDGFDYGHAAKQVSLMPIWYLAARNDFSLGHRFDVKQFMAESGNKKAKYSVLSKHNGAQKDYDHVNMLTAPECTHDHFPAVHQWLQSHE